MIDQEFHCPKWPFCGCPDGAVASDCPGLAKVKRVVRPATAPEETAAYRRDMIDAGRGHLLKS